MDLLLILTYTAICVTVFKVFKIPLNKWSVPTAILGGALLLGGLIFVMNYNDPYADISREYFVTTPIVPAVSGKVIEVPVKSNARLHAGEVLFKIDPVPYQSRVTSAQARLKQAKDDQRRARELLRRKAGTQRSLDLATANVDDLQAQLGLAKYELAQTVVLAPTDGYVTQLALRPGMMAVKLPLRPVMIFVHDEGKYYIAWFRQNNLLRLEIGDKAEVAFDGIPGKVFSGRVQSVLPAMAEGQVQPSGNLISPGLSSVPGRVAVLIRITDPKYKQYADRIPGGAFGQSAVYTRHFHHIAIIRKVLLRMSSWMNYLFPFH